MMDVPDRVPFACYNRFIVHKWTKSTSAVHRRSMAAPAVHQGINEQDPPVPLVKVDRNGQQSLSSSVL
jgi:hypothetical protein